MDILLAAIAPRVPGDQVSSRLASSESLPRRPPRKQHRAFDFLAGKCREGEVVDFHRLRHTSGAWLAMTGAHPKVVQSVMRHSNFTLTLDTNGHLFPGAPRVSLPRPRCNRRSSQIANPRVAVRRGARGRTNRPQRRGHACR